MSGALFFVLFSIYLLVCYCLNRLQEKHKQMKMDGALSNSDNVKVEPKQQKQLDSKTNE